MTITAPTPIADGPVVPDSSQPEASFDTQYEAFNTWEKTVLLPGMNATAANVYTNAQEAANAATSAALDAGLAMGYRNDASASSATATSAASTATAKAADADASAIAASKLNLGAKGAAPTADNQGEALRVGATYFDTRPDPAGGWKVWTGSAWTAGLSGMAGVVSLNGQQGDLSLTTLAGYGITDAVERAVALGNVDLNTATTSGFFSLGTPTNGPAGVVNSQLIVSRSGATCMQIVTDAATGAMFVRGASGLTGTPAWSAWRRVALHSEIVVAASGGAMDCAQGSYFTLAVSANTTLSFSNVPGGAYSCVLEVNHTGGTITFPAGTVWAGAAPALATGKRHLFFFQRAQLGTVGWYASALAGYSA